MRLFVAIHLPDSWKDVLAKPQASIGWLGRGVRWVEPEAMHLTLRFLGEVDEKHLTALDTRLSAACEGIGPLEVRIKGTGVFPSAKRPRVYWAGVEAPRVLMDLQRRIEDEMQKLGFDPEEKSFHPHLTLARIKEPTGKDRMTDALLSFALEGPLHTVRDVALIRSHLSSDGPRYETLRTYPLIGAESPSAQ